MLRIQRDDMDAHRVVLSLQGRIVAEWAELVESECLDLIRSGVGVELELSEVVFIGRSGFEVLSRLSRIGVAMTGSSPLIAAMLAQEGIAVKPRPA